MANRNRVLAGKRGRLTARAEIIQSIRDFFTTEGYLEIGTPLLLPAVAPEAFIDPIAVAGDLFLQTSPELCMKRLVAAGYERIFQISHCWRDRERGKLHLPEFTMLEWYRANADYRSLMIETKMLLEHIVQQRNPHGVLHYQGADIDFAGEWKAISVADAFVRYGGIGMEEALLRDEFDQLMVERIEPALGNGRPEFLFDYPATRSALARLKEHDRSLAERFELYVAGIELANGFSELIDPLEQRSRFLHEIDERRQSGSPPLPLPEQFLNEIAAMPPTAGIALGIDRLVLLLTDATTIDEVVAFTPEEL